MNILVTGGAGFIGSELVRYLVENTENTVVNVDKLTYSGNLQSLVSVASNEKYIFKQIDICDEKELKRVFEEHKPDIVMHLAAYAGVRHSLVEPEKYLTNNIMGTHNLIEACKKAKIEKIHMSLFFDFVLTNDLIFSNPL